VSIFNLKDLERYSRLSFLKGSLKRLKAEYPLLSSNEAFGYYSYLREAISTSIARHSSTMRLFEPYLQARPIFRQPQLCDQVRSAINRSVATLRVLTRAVAAIAGCCLDPERILDSGCNVAPLPSHPGRDGTSGRSRPSATPTRTSCASKPAFLRLLFRLLFLACPFSSRPRRHAHA